MKLLWLGLLFLSSVDLFELGDISSDLALKRENLREWWILLGVF